MKSLFWKKFEISTLIKYLFHRKTLDQC